MLQRDRLRGATMGNPLTSLPTEGTQGWEERQRLLFGSLSPHCLASTHVPVGHVPVRALAVGQHLPHDNAVAPYIAGRGELAVCDGLRCRPANGDLPPLKKQATEEAQRAQGSGTSTPLQLGQQMRQVICWGGKD